ncbi:hypothetical protein HQ45_03690 [Porphyromonas crevioricanis]|uniref:tRNA-specific adenosine deaminase n=2 Tax=Porphyromonas crevioricanis TaxID=393921 RepID=A0A0A2FSY7_9PORP|nr:nucleoside deaminase [Porphyromonas crevioricanis]KGN89944.1 hypothetical protein HQ45_03690 [Porphyromonas crevioricanis]KGN94128.1 hypothetical protein HQ38_06180 [Porphyromonas crevioricanis]SJZ66442.1 tRNA(adenine34) deaminase [Porphyromonas crevioricanis]SQH73937.1 tRNA-specific adenosine deaminase [Porphyromonas crevioricanis]GAD04681.1 tRNA-specific adenosine-34 deaminase [Porphyromonas crevioricanis JCM 15906]
MIEYNIDEQYMRLALEEADMALREEEVPIGAIVVCNGKVIGRAHNRVEALKDVTAHAEMLAITSASEYLGSKYLTNCILYVTVEPCPMCAAAIGWARVGKLVYGATEDKFGYNRIGRAPLLHKTCQVQSGILAQDCAALMQGFFRKHR